MKICFLKANDLEVKWTANQPFTIRNGNLYVTPTNFRSISYLDLDEFSFDGLAHVPELQQYSEIIDFTYRQKQLLGRYSLECQQRKRVSSDLTMHVVMEFADRAHYRILADRFSLLWSLTSSAEYADLDIRNITGAYNLSILHRRFMKKRIYKLLFDWRNSKVIVHYFKTLCANPDFHRYLCFRSPNSYLQNFIAHSEAVDFDARAFIYELWRHDKGFDSFSPLQLALERQASDDLMFYLNAFNLQKCPYIFSWLEPQYPLGEEISWPFLGVCVTSQAYFHCLEFKTLLVCDIAAVASEALLEMEDLIYRIRIVWRAIPTPYLRMKDLRECTERAIRHFEGRLMVSNDPATLWEMLVKAFPKDCVSEMYQPRPLMHLARCVVRQVLHSPKKIPFHHLPATLKDYVKLKF